MTSPHTFDFKGEATLGDVASSGYELLSSLCALGPSRGPLSSSEACSGAARLCALGLTSRDLDVCTSAAEARIMKFRMLFFLDIEPLRKMHR